MGSRVKSIAPLAVAVVLFLAVIVLTFERPVPPEMPYVSLSAQPNGTKAVSMLLQEKEHRVRTWPYSWERLSVSGQRTLLVVQPSDVGDKERDALKRWVESGGRLLLFAASPGTFSWIPMERLSQDTSNVNVVKTTKAAVTYGYSEASAYDADVPASVRIRGDKGITPLMTDSQGIVAADYKIGNGTVTVFVTPSWLTNDNILKRDHFALVWPMMRNAGDQLWIDEFHHGHRKQPGLFTVYPAWLLLGIMQLALAALLWLWLRGKRFGPVYVPREWIVRRGDETLLAVAKWYERRACRQEALQFQERYVRRLLQERWNVPASATDEQLIAMIRSRWEHRHVQLLDRLLARFAAVRSLVGDGSRSRYHGKQFHEDTALAAQVVSLLDKET